jgi:hypothetical protein
MTTETTTPLSPAEAIAESKRFFTRTLIGYSGTIEDETDTSLLLNDFRNRIAISVIAPEQGETSTRVRVSTLRPDERVAKYVSFIRTARPATGIAGAEPA